MNDESLVAERILFAIDKNNSEVEIRIAVGKPYPIDNSWACAVKVDPLHKNLHDIYGVDSWQSLQLASKLVKILLEDFVEKGGKLYFEKGGNEETIDEIFENRPPLQQPTPSAD
jgi:hypothetical protein